jgi:hypothetical protein
MPAHRLNDFDKLLVERAQQLLWAAIRADLVKPAQLVSLAKVDDRGNPWLDEELESQNSDEEEPIDAGTAAQAWTIVPCDEFERRLAETVVPGEVNAREPQFTYGVDECGSCNCDLLQRGLAIDGKMKGQILWGNFCVPCFLRECEGIGWGRGQLYAKQPSGGWRQVAGFEP